MRFNSPKQLCMSLWKVGGALHSPKGILSHSYKPMLPKVKVAYCLDSSSIGTCQNLELRSKVDNGPLTLDSPRSHKGEAKGESLLWSEHSAFGSQCRNRVIHPPFIPRQQYCTKGCYLVRPLPHPTSISSVLSPHPIEEVGSCGTAP